jgi:hypothetical protein
LEIAYDISVSKCLAFHKCISARSSVKEERERTVLLYEGMLPAPKACTPLFDKQNAKTKNSKRGRVGEILVGIVDG